MTDDPRDILRAAGVECAEVEAYFEWDSDRDSAGEFVHEMADPAILALARLVAKYKWQRDYAVDIAEEYGGCDFADLDRRWEERDADA